MMKNIKGGLVLLSLSSLVYILKIISMDIGYIKHGNLIPYTMTSEEYYADITQNSTEAPVTILVNLSKPVDEVEMMDRYNSSSKFNTELQENADIFINEYKKSCLQYLKVIRHIKEKNMQLENISLCPCVPDTIGKYIYI